jgi:hypothetical protein
VSNGRGKYFYFDAEQRKQIRNSSWRTDSHSSIIDFYQKEGKIAKGNNVEDKFNKFEYDPLTKRFSVDQINTKNDSEHAERFVNNLDFKTIIPELIIKPIIHPFEDCKKKRVSKEIISLLKEWNSVFALVNKANKLILDSVNNSVFASVNNSVFSLVNNSVFSSVPDLVFASVLDSVWAYFSSFFDLKNWGYVEHKEGFNPFQCCIDLWEMGIVPSFDGNTYRLHSGKNADVIYVIDKKDLENL